MPDNIADKTALRRTLLADRQAIAIEVRRQWDAAIGARVTACLMERPVTTLGVYWPIRGEPDLMQAYAELAQRGIRLALPMVVRRDAPLDFAAWQPGDALATDAFGVAIPATPIKVWPDALLVPCVGFNDANIRLGYGSGFYDRTLTITPRPLTLGVAYACCRAAFAGDPHDAVLDLIATEQSVSVSAVARRSANP